MDPVIMFAIPRLAIVWWVARCLALRAVHMICTLTCGECKLLTRSGLTVYPDGPLDVLKPKKDMPPFFRGYRQLLTRIKCVFIFFVV